MAKSPSSFEHDRDRDFNPRPDPSLQPAKAAVAQAPVSPSERARYSTLAHQAEADRKAAAAEKFYMGERGGVTQAEVEMMNRALEKAGGTVEARERIERTWQRGMTDAGLTAALADTAAPIMHAGNMPGMPSFSADTMNVRPALATKETDEAAAKAAGTEAEKP